MYLLDTDHLTILERGGGASQKLRSRLSTVNPREVGTTIISYEEQMRGWLDNVARASDIEAQVRSITS